MNDDLGQTDLVEPFLSHHTPASSNESFLVWPIFHMITFDQLDTPLRTGRSVCPPQEHNHTERNRQTGDVQPFLRFSDLVGAL
jgi:hypothetical protein